MAIYIYGLVDPRTGGIRYVGKSGRPHDRRFEHINMARKGMRTHRCCWIRVLLREGLEPGMLHLEKCEGDGCDAERRWIADLRAAGVKLTNETEGGDGIAHMSPEVRRKLSASKRSSQRNRAAAMANLARARNSPKAKIRTKEWRATMHAKMLGRTFSPETREKMSAAKRGCRPVFTKFTLEQEKAIADEYRQGGRTLEIANRLGVRRDLVSAILKRHGVQIRPHALTPEQVAKMAIGKRGKKQSPEHKAARLAACRASQEKRDQKVIDEYRLGKSAAEVASALGYDRTSIYSILRRHGVPLRR